MVILVPLLDLAGFFQLPFSITTETSDKDHDVIVRGRIDLLVLQEKLWILVIESKKTKFNVTAGLPQVLVYMLKNCQ
ncbi:hypothetical protein [Okeania sp.]|uniref:hypothetical protein n=1 Tax=Okeania sp. TaxID=3100323 RepID=UPI002B4B24D2|nr:hypothetical protein [Okeania sp.]MEB3343379.1 hypothetical protein [Okeania sp.]